MGQKIMGNLFINPDGADAQSQATLAYLRQRSGIEASWNNSRGCYEAEPEINRWHNCREQGYVVSLRSQDYSRTLNVAFFKHRNSDEICAVEFEFRGLNPPTINDIPKGHPYRDSKYAVSHKVDHDQPAQMAEWIYERLTDFWNATKKQTAA